MTYKKFLEWCMNRLVELKLDYGKKPLRGEKIFIERFGEDLKAKIFEMFGTDLSVEISDKGPFLYEYWTLITGLSIQREITIDDLRKETRKYLEKIETEEERKAFLCKLKER